MKRLILLSLISALPALAACAKGHVHTNLRGQTIVGEEVFYGVGLYHVPVEDFREVSEAGFNLVTSKAMWGDPVQDSVLKALDEAEKHGLKMLAEFDYPEATRAAHKPYNSHPALLAWYVHEPELTVNDQTLAAMAHKNLRRADFDHPVFTTIKDRRAYGAYGRFTRILALEIYPIPLGGLHWPAAAITQAQQEAQTLSIWSVIQTHVEKPALEDPARPARRPTLDEIRVMTYLAIIWGARGIMFWGYDHGKMKTEAPELWKGLGKLAKELRKISPIATLKNSGMIEIEGAAPKSHAAIRNLGEEWYLLYGNPSNEAESIDLIMPVTWPGEKRITLELEAHQAGALKLVDGKLVNYK